MARHQRGKPYQERACRQNYGFSKPSPPALKNPEPEAFRKSSSPASKKRAAGSKTSRSRGDSTSTKRTSVSSAPEESSSKGKAPGIKTPPSTTTLHPDEPTPISIPIGLLVVRGVSAQNAALEVLFSTFSDDESAGEYLSNLINAPGREHPFMLEKFKMKVHNFGHCDQEECDGKHQDLTKHIALNATVPAEHHDLIIGDDDDDEYKCEIQYSTNYIIQKALRYDEASELPCPQTWCDGTMNVEPCIIQYPEFLLVPIDREDPEALLHMVNLMNLKVGSRSTA
ncbi:hypothetical protein DOTSEDRAFT_48951 [Dothistroma septosporum NZE10]|uniref:Uncharacterized protein n=1 Tax=Dothistroma septosporum (strain NZE10 / CBS 128990) TaxID=675120 RepID=N1PZQ0_DOTSN|nr:hypothetical protein DOTSEDRAFT_48951 [Dothistroma septosporum NZE10]